jgi:predicted DsbA family dithiol-disulfide isomerase
MKLVHFPLHPETPDEGRTLQEMFRCGPEEIQSKNDRMRGLMEAEGLPYNDRSHTYNSRLAQELGSWADTQKGGDAIHLPIYQAYFVDNRNVGDPEVLLDIVKTVGLDVDAARDVLENRTFKDAVDTDWATSRDCGVTGVPTYIAGGRGVIGAQPYEAIAGLLEAAGVDQKAVGVAE